MFSQKALKSWQDSEEFQGQMKGKEEPREVEETQRTLKGFVNLEKLEL